MSKFNYQFSNLCGAVYKQGNIVFTGNGDTVLSPVGNRISQFDLKNNKSCTFPFENSKNIRCFAVSPNGLLLVSVDEDGRALLVNLFKKTVLHHFNFKQTVYDIKFSPDGRYLAVTHGRRVQVWRAPGHGLDFAPFSLLRTLPGQYDDTLCIDWSDDSSFLAVGSRDSSCRVYCVLPRLPGFTRVTLAAHRSALVACCFQHSSLNVYTVSRDGAVVVWECSMTLGEMREYVQTASQSAATDERADADGKTADVVSGAPDSDDDEEDAITMDTVAVVTKQSEQQQLQKDCSEDEEGEGEGSTPVRKKTRVASVCQWSKKAKHLFLQERGCHVTCAVLHKPSGLMVVGFSSGVFSLHEMPDFNPIHTLSMSQHQISSVAVNPTGEWLAFGCRDVGQLLVWEWQSESYVLKQQGHFYDMSSLSHSPDGSVIATGGDDGKVKLWNTSSGFCFVTFSEHSSAVSDVVFSASGKVVVSASLDGTVRAFDLHRYRNFRTFASPRPAQFSCLTLDPSGEVVCAGSHDTFEIFVWSMQTGRLLELLASHEAPVSSLSFSPTRSLLVSGSWDKSVRLWSVFEGKGGQEALLHTTDVTSLTFRPDGVQLAVATLDGQISFWDVLSAVQTGSIEGRNDLHIGRRDTDKVTAKKLTGGSCFTSLCYTADGDNVLAGGRSKFVCIYNVAHQVLLKKFQISRNLSFDGMLQFLNSARMTEAGPLELLSDEEEEEGGHLSLSLPGVRKGDMSSRRTKPEIRVKRVQFSPTGRSWAAVSTEGLLIYSLEAGLVFDPYDLSLEVTPDRVRGAIKERQFAEAVMMSFKLNEKELKTASLEAVPFSDIQLIVQTLPLVYVEKLVPFLAEGLDSSPHLQFYLHWCATLLTAHGGHLKRRAGPLMAALRSLQKTVLQKQADLGKICDANGYLLQYSVFLAGSRAGETHRSSFERTQT